MIIRLSPGVAKLALRVVELREQKLLLDWRHLQLLIQPGQYDEDCGPNGSPWILTGCWPRHRTGVDIANYRPDFPTICYNAFELDPDGRIVFHLDERLWQLPPGRYSGILRVYPQGHVPVNLRTVQDVGYKEPDPRTIPAEYLNVGKVCQPEFKQPPLPRPKPQCCILSTFDIDLGPLCSDHMVDQVALDYVLTTCEEE